MDVTGRLAQANGRLKAHRVRVRIQQLGGKLYLRATLPPPPDKEQTKAYQQRIALGIGANPRGVQLAEQEARKVGALLDCREFDWTPYLKDEAKPPESVGDWTAKFEAEYRHTVNATTWRTEFRQVFSQLPADKPLTADLLLTAIASTVPNTRNHGHRVTIQFNRYSIPFSPYDLRHRWAVRTLEFGLPDSHAAKQMGHSVTVHERIYHHWITAETHQRAFDVVVMRSDRPQPPHISG